MSLFLTMLLALSPSAAQQLTLLGRVICVNEAGRAAECGPDSRYALRDAGGALHYFEPGDTRTPIFADERFRSRNLEVHVWERDGRLEIIKVYSLIDGQRFLPHYFCDVCTITSFTGGLCWCCQREFEFRETKVPQ